MKTNTQPFMLSVVNVCLSLRGLQHMQTRVASGSTLVKGFALALASLLALIAQSHGATTVSGMIAGQTWAASGSPYLVAGNLTVASLTIQPGVNVLFQGNYVMEVDGWLTAIGTAQNKIVFSTHPTNTVGWQGIFFNQSPPVSQLANCLIERSINSGMRFVGTSATISDCIIRSNSASGPVSTTSTVFGGGINSDTALALNNCIVQNNTATALASGDPAIATAGGGGIYVSTRLTMNNCSILSNSIYAQCTSPGLNLYADAEAIGGGVLASNLTLANCTIVGNSATAYEDGAYQAYQLTVRSLGGGLYSKGSLTEINSIVTGNNTSASTPNYGWDVTIVAVAGGGEYLSGSLASLSNCIVAYNNPDVQVSVLTIYTFRFC